MGYGVTDQGFVVKPLEISVSELNAALQALFGTGVDLTASEPLGQLVGLVADRENELWNILQGVYAARYPDSASGDALVEVCGLTGTVPLAPTKSLVTAALTGVAGTLIAAGKQASVTGAGTKFQNKADATLVAVAAIANTTAYTLGARKKTGANVYQVKTAGTTGTGTRPSSVTPGSDEVDGTVHWTFLGVGAAAIDSQFEAVDVGPKTANAFSLTTIETPVAGWQGCVNELDAIPGRDYETDAALRLRRETELRVNGAAAADAIRADVLATLDASGTPFVAACKIFVNDTDAVNGDGLLPHSIDAVVLYAGSPDSVKDDAIRASIFGSVAAGIATNGAVSGTLTDDSGNVQTVKFDRPTEKDVWIIVTVTKDPVTWPSDGVDQVKVALVAFAQNYSLGDDVIVSHLYPPVLDGVSGIVDVSFKVGFSDPPTLGANLAIGVRELAAFDTSRITVNVS